MSFFDLDFHLRKQIINLKEVKQSIEFAKSFENVVCIGVDGPTASGKTVFAELLRDEIKNFSSKDVKIIPLDGLLIERKFREKCLNNLQKVKMPFEHEAENHMRFSKFEELLNFVQLKKANAFEAKNIVLRDLYSRNDQGRCTGNLKINLTNNTVLIFEGHYTTRPEFSQILDHNFILLAERSELIKRKIERVSSYRNKEEVLEYFNLIDEPSYLSNYFRFASQNSFFIDNTNFEKPFLSNYEHIFKLLDTEKFLNHNNIPINKIKEFIFGLHGLSNYYDSNIDSFESIFEEFCGIKELFSRSLLSNIFRKYDLEHKIIYFDYVKKFELEVGLIVKFFEKACTWIISQKNDEIKHLISWEGGIYKIEKGIVSRLPTLKTLNYLQKDNFWANLEDGNAFISSSLLNNNIKNNFNAYCFLKNSSRISFLATTFRYTQIRCRALGDFFMIAPKGFPEDKLEKITSFPIPFRVNEISLKKRNYFHEENESFFLTQDFLLLKRKLNKEIINQLIKIYFGSDDIGLRETILVGLMHDDNKSFVSEKIRKYLTFSIGFFPSSMSRFYVLRRMGIEDGNVLATNIYDITENPIDSSAYLEAAFEESLPTILQISLNASGQVEKTAEGKNIVGYLEPKDGINDFTDSISLKLVKILEGIDSKTQIPPLIGIGLDHVDLRGDVPSGRSTRFLRNAIQTECVTHITLDGSESFKPKKKLFHELFNAYESVFKTSLRFLDKCDFEGIDLEFCTGELNYIGNDSEPHYPDGKEMALLPLCFYKSLQEEKNIEYKTNLLNSIKLYVGNLGTCHHAIDKENSLRIQLGDEWQEALLGTNFLSPVLHGTTGSSDKTFLLASKSCQKINIAGSLLKVLLENLSQENKDIIGFDSFDEKSKLLCKNFAKLKFDKVLFNKKELKDHFIRYCRINNVKSISEKHLKVIRKPFYGRNKISNHIFSKLKQIVD